MLYSSQIIDLLAQNKILKKDFHQIPQKNTQPNKYPFLPSLHFYIKSNITKIKTNTKPILYNIQHQQQQSTPYFPLINRPNFESTILSYENRFINQITHSKISFHTKLYHKTSNPTLFSIHPKIDIQHICPTLQTFLSNIIMFVFPPSLIPPPSICRLLLSSNLRSKNKIPPIPIPHLNPQIAQIQSRYISNHYAKIDHRRYINRVEMNHLTRSLHNTFAKTKKPIRVAVTGAAGQICYSLLFRIAHGDMLGYDQPIILHLIDIPQAQKALSGVAMEIGDCAFPLLQNIVCTDNLKTGFQDVEAALLVGAKPRGKGQERADLLLENAKIFIPQGKALNDYAHRDVRTLVVGNPANTNALIAATHAKDLPKKNFAAMTRLDHDRAVWQVAEKTGSTVGDIAKVVIWGNHSPTMSPDLAWATVKGKPALDIVGDEWYTKTFIPRVQKRGAEIIENRGLSSAASAGNAALEHMRSWFLGHNHDWISFGIWSTGNSYNVPSDIYYSFPVTVQNKEWSVVNGLNISEKQRQRMTVTANELLEERKAIEGLLKV